MLKHLQLSIACLLLYNLIVWLCAGVVYASPQAGGASFWECLHVTYLFITSIVIITSIFAGLLIWIISLL